MPTALITGGTSGIGLSFARRLAREGYDLVLVARTRPRLEDVATNLKRECGIDVETISADLSKIRDCRAVEKRLVDPDAHVDMLVNNAGFGLYDGDFIGHHLADEDRLVMVNIRAVMRLTHAALRPMVARSKGDIINVSSIASFAPDPMAPTYAASKAWVTSFSEGLREQLAETGVRLMALAPGLVPTEFQERAGVDAHVPGAFWLDADDVVETALKDLRAGHGISLPGTAYRALSVAMRLTPRRIYLPLSQRLQRRMT